MFSANHFVRMCVLAMCVLASLGVRISDAARPQRVTAGPPLGTGNWHVTFEDEFDGNTLKTALWRTCDFVQIGIGCRGGSPSELAWHMPDDVLVQNGTARLRAQQRTVFDDQGGRHDLTSGFITTRERFNFRYGYFETRVKMPRGRAMWPAFFTTPVRRRDHNPEIDVFELLGTDPTKTYLTYHFPDVAPPNHQIQYEYVDPSGFDTNFHTFGVLWDPGLLVFYVDGIERWRTTDRVTDEHTQLALRYGVGVNWQGNGFLDSTSIFPSYFDVEYVKVWQRGNALSGTITDDANDFDKVFAFSQTPVRYSDNAAEFEGDTTRWAAPNNDTNFIAWDVSGSRNFQATTFQFPPEPARAYRFFASSDLINYNEITPSAAQSQPGWRKTIYSMNLPAGTRLVKVQFPVMSQAWQTTISKVVYSPDASIPTPTPQPTSTTGPVSTSTLVPVATNTSAPTATNTPRPAVTNTPGPAATSTTAPGTNVIINIRAQNSGGTPFNAVRTTALNQNSGVLTTRNTNAQGDATLNVTPGSYKICQDVPANHRALFGQLDEENRACVWFTLNANNALNLLFPYEQTAAGPTPTPIPTVTPVPGGNTRVTYRVVAAPKSIQNFRFTDNLTGGNTSIELDDASPDDGDGFGNERSTNVNAGAYTIAATVPAGWYLSGITCTPTAGALVDLQQTRVTLNVSSGVNVTCNFLVNRYAEISANVWNDLNRDGRPVSGEAQQNGWTIGLYRSLNGGLGSLLSQSVTTNGQVRFSNLARDNYLVCVTAQTGWSLTYPTAQTQVGAQTCYAITAFEGSVTELWYGYARTVASAATAEDSSGGDTARLLLQGYPAPVIHKLPDISTHRAGYEYVDSPQRVYLPLAGR